MKHHTLDSGAKGQKEKVGCSVFSSLLLGLINRKLLLCVG